MEGSLAGSRCGSGMIEHMHSAPPRDLRTEMMQRMNDDWHLDGDRRDSELWMVHLVLPPVWRVLLELVNPVAWIFGATYPTVSRRLHVWIDAEGTMHRATTGKIPARWPQSHSWDVPDGPVEPTV
jgi:hypothetical protein